ncbi:MAG: flavodoxin domain-containing protein [Lachnospiraceae bacterium]|nr:flavodoxin domain-containing protein [Lachnospiraceae bacterium]
MKLSIIYDSKTGNTKQAAEWIADGMNSVDGIDAKTFSIKEVDIDFVKESKGVVIGSPSYAANMTPDLHAWLLTTGGKLALAGNLAGAFATEQYTHGGGELVVQSIMTTELVNGMLYYSSGGGCGKPYIHIGPVGVNGNMETHNALENYKDYFTIYGERFAKKADELFG